MNKCGHCNAETDGTTINGDPVCDTCTNELYSDCRNCSEPTLTDDLTAVVIGRVWSGNTGRYINQERSFCPECIDNHAFTCSDCSVIYPNDQASGADGDRCEKCQENYSSCESCGREFHHDALNFDRNDDGPFCNACYNEQEADHCDCDLINDYSYKPYPLFFHTDRSVIADGKKIKKQITLDSKQVRSVIEFFGVETETSIGRSDDDLSYLAEKFHSELCKKQLSEFAYMKEDGSISGFEIVTHPFSWQWFKDRGSDYLECFDALRKAGMRSYNAEDGSCGMHVHISKECFRDSMILYKFLKLFYDNPSWTETVSRRRGSDLHTWASLYKRSTLPSVAHAHKEQRNGIAVARSRKHHSIDWERGAINLGLRSTVEVRLFRGTLNAIGFRRNMEIVKSALDYCAIAKIAQVDRVNFTNYVQDHHKNFPHAAEFLTNITGASNQKDQE